jgi:hypothetical protein
VSECQCLPNRRGGKVEVEENREKKKEEIERPSFYGFFNRVFAFVQDGCVFLPAPFFFPHIAFSCIFSISPQSCCSTFFQSP